MDLGQLNPAFLPRPSSTSSWSEASSIEEAETEIQQLNYPDHLLAQADASVDRVFDEYRPDIKDKKYKRALTQAQINKLHAKAERKKANRQAKKDRHRLHNKEQRKGPKIDLNAWRDASAQEAESQSLDHPEIWVGTSPIGGVGIIIGDEFDFWRLRQKCNTKNPRPHEALAIELACTIVIHLKKLNQGGKCITINSDCIALFGFYDMNSNRLPYQPNVQRTILRTKELARNNGLEIQFRFVEAEKNPAVNVAKMAGIEGNLRKITEWYPFPDDEGLRKKFNVPEGR